MATIDKPLPNVSETVVEVPKQEELIQERDEIIEKKNQQGNIEVTMDEEGGAEIAFDPRAVTEEGGQDHFENLADFLGEQVLEPLGAKMVDQYNEYKESRGDWEDTYRNGLELLGFKYERRTEPFRGAVVSITRSLLKLLRNFKRKLIKSYYRLTDQYERK